MDYDKMQFTKLDDLLKLPWFAKNDKGEFMIKPGADVPPIYDDHSHLGWSFFAGHVIDHQKYYGPTKFYYDFTTEEEFIHEQGTHPSKKENNMMTFDCATIFFRCPPHAKCQTVPNLIESLDRFGIKGQMLAPIEVPFRARHARQTFAAIKADKRLYAYAAVHPQTPTFKERIDDMVSQGARGLKYHPEFQFYPPNAKRAMRIFEYCEQIDLPVMCHSGSTGVEPPMMRSLSDLKRFDDVFKAFPNLKFTLGHAGLIYPEPALEYQKKYPNVYLDLAGQAGKHIALTLKHGDHDRIMYGSDWAFYPMEVTLARTLIELEKYPKSREKVMGANCKRLYKLD